MPPHESLVPTHGGFRRLKSFQVAQLVYDLTVRFCDVYIDRRSRTHDQMVQAARSGVQNIAEGSVASGTSKKTEIKLTNVARASLEELRLDYEDFVRQRQLPKLERIHPAMKRFAQKRCGTLLEVRTWVGEEVQRAMTDLNGLERTKTDRSRKLADPLSVLVRSSPSKSVLASVFAANAALSLLYVACYLLDRQVAALAKAFEQDGGFTERMYRIRSKKRNPHG